MFEDDNVDDAVEAEVSPETEADSPYDAVDVAIIEDSALESVEDLIAVAEDDTIDIHDLVEAVEEDNIPFASNHLTATGPVIIGVMKQLSKTQDVVMPHSSKFDKGQWWHRCVVKINYKIDAKLKSLESSLQIVLHELR